MPSSEKNEAVGIQKNREPSDRHKIINNTTEDANKEIVQVPRRSTRVRREPDRFGDYDRPKKIH